MVGVGVTAGPDTGTTTGSITAVPNGLAHVTVDVTVQLLHIVVGVIQWVVIGVTQSEVAGNAHVHVLHMDEVLHPHIEDVTVGDVLHIVQLHMEDVLHIVGDVLQHPHIEGEDVTVEEVLHMEEAGLFILKLHHSFLPVQLYAVLILTIALYTTPILVFNLG